MRGSIAGGSEVAVDAGIFALRNGGNAVDAVIAAQLAATVSEPILTGLCGAGIAMLHSPNKSLSIDMFSAHPGTKGYHPHPLDTITINFGPTSQDFSIGLGSIATPSLWKGLLFLHENFASLPLTLLAEPAISAAKNGIHISKTIAYVLKILWPICSYTKEIQTLLSFQDRPFGPGDIFYAPTMAEDIRDFVQNRHDFLRKGRIGDSLWGLLSEKSSLTIEDIDAYQVHSRKPNVISVGTSKVLLPNAPSIGAQYVLRYLQKLADDTSMIHQLHIMKETLQEMNSVNIHEIFNKMDESTIIQDFSEISAGFTSHISVIDNDGLSVGLTSSLGESCGYVIPNTCLILNNFLGESDVCPEFLKGKVEKRLLTMCCPTIATNEDSTMVLGSGGSSRIRTAIFYTIMHRLLNQKSLSESIHSPRIHVEDGLIQLELHGQPKSILDTISSSLEFGSHKLEFFEELSMFFGGVHAVEKYKNTFEAIGDIRREGIGKVLM